MQASTDSYIYHQSRITIPKIRQTEKCKTHIQTTEVKGEPNKTAENKCSFCNGTHRFYKYQSYLTMASLEKFNTVKRKKLCYYRLRYDHFTSKCKSKNTCLTESCSAKHHTTLHDYFLLKQKKRGKDSDKHVKDGSKSTKKKGESVKINTYKTSKISEKVFSQIVPEKVMKNDGEAISTFALLENCSQSNLTREHLAKKLKLKGYSRIINISSIKNEPESVKLKKISLKIYNMDQKNEVEVEAYTLPKIMFNMPSQSSPSNGDNQNTFDHLEDIQIPKICASEVTILIGANARNKFLQLEVRRGNPRKPYAFKTILGWSLLSNTTKREKYHRKMEGSIS